jgi:hypothetical protein
VSKPKYNAQPIESDPFVTFSEWSTEADDIAFAHLADARSEAEVGHASNDRKSGSGMTARNHGNRTRPGKDKA